MVFRCKECDKINTNGTNFCTRKCRMNWIHRHNKKGGRKRAQKAYDRELMKFGSNFSNEDYFDRKDD